MGLALMRQKWYFLTLFCIIRFDRIEDGEDRWHAVGQVNGEMMFLVVHTTHYNNQTEVIRIISARRPNKHERRFYESKK